MDYLKTVEELQTHFFRQTSGFEKYKFKCSAKDLVTVARFVKWGKKKYRKAFDVDFLIKYFEFQYSYYSGLKTKFGRGVIMINWIVGKKAIQRYEERDLSKNRYKKFILNKNSIGVLKKLEISTVKKRNKKEKVKLILKINHLEESFKETYFNTEKGYLFCCSQTTLFNQNSDFCKNCKFAKQCKETLKENYPVIYNVRKEYGAIGQ